MTTKLNLNRLMGVDEGYLRALQVPERDREALAVSREEIRDTLRYAFRHWDRYVSLTELRDSALPATVVPDVPTPKFRIQGSFAYHTANDTQDPPAQQIDQDDGIFLPISFVSVAGRARPTIASAAYFRIVERALAPLCEKRGWTLNPRKAKNSCVRVEIDARLHIDLPLYAIKDSAFEQLVETVAKSAMASFAAIRDARDLDDRIYRELADAEIILAHRQQGWIESDPRKLETWFQNAIDLYGLPVRQLSRCFKGLRDVKFDEGLSSICIMASVVRAVERLGHIDPKRLDLTIVQVAREMARLVGTPVDNPVFPGDAGKYLCAGWDAAYRERVRALFAEAADRMEEAIDGTYHKGLALTRARQAFGLRIPDREDLIGLGAPGIVRSIEPQPQPRAIVPRTKSG